MSAPYKATHLLSGPPGALLLLNWLVIVITIQFGCNQFILHCLDLIFISVQAVRASVQQLTVFLNVTIIIVLDSCILNAS